MPTRQSCSEPCLVYVLISTTSVDRSAHVASLGVMHLHRSLVNRRISFIQDSRRTTHESMERAGVVSGYGAFLMHRTRGYQRLAGGGALLHCGGPNRLVWSIAPAKTSGWSTTWKKVNDSCDQLILHAERRAPLMRRYSQIQAIQGRK